MKPSLLLTALLVTLSLATTANAQTLEKITASNKITVSYREASVPFSYLIGSSKSVGFSVELTEAIIDDVRKKVKKPTLEVAYMSVTSQNRIPLLMNGTIDLECGSTTNNSVRAKDVTFAINQFFELGVILAHHAGVGLNLQRVAHHFQGGRILGIGHQAEQQDVVHGKSRGAVTFDQQE